MSVSSLPPRRGVPGSAGKPRQVEQVSGHFAHACHQRMHFTVRAIKRVPVIYPSPNPALTIHTYTGRLHC